MHLLDSDKNNHWTCTGTQCFLFMATPWFDLCLKRSWAVTPQEYVFTTASTAFYFVSILFWHDKRYYIERMFYGSAWQTLFVRYRAQRAQIYQSTTKEGLHGANDRAECVPRNFKRAGVHLDHCKLAESSMLSAARQIKTLRHFDARCWGHHTFNSESSIDFRCRICRGIPEQIQCKWHKLWWT